MKVCIILEGCYPYVHGGVSSWVHDYIGAMSEHEFLIWVITDSNKKKGQFVYKLPANVVEVREEFLDNALIAKDVSAKKIKFSKQEREELKKLIMCEELDEEVLFRIFHEKGISFMTFLKSRIFLDIIEDICETHYPSLAFSDLFHSIRSMILPILYLLTRDIPEADIYHSICTGYAGLLGSLGSWYFKKPLVLSEHGIYTREREEEIIRAKWVMPGLKNQWIKLYYMLAKITYSRADRVTALFGRANKSQIGIGCQKKKCMVVKNGIRYERFGNIQLKQDNGVVDIGAIVRVARIKDIKTLLYAFYELNRKKSETILHIIGPVDDEEYKKECLDLIDSLNIKNVKFTGMVKIDDYMEQLDFVVLSSISEGQPLSVLESFASNRPCITTDVGCCRELIYGDAGDELGAAGICVPPLNKNELAKAMEYLCENKDTRIKMGNVGRERVSRFYRHEDMLEHYKEVYKEVCSGRSWV